MSHLKHTVKAFSVAFPLALCAALAATLYWSPYPIQAIRSLVSISAGTVVFTFIIGRLLDKMLLPRINQLALSDRVILLLTAGFLGSMLFWNLGFEVPDRYLFLPNGSLRLTNTGEANDRSSDTKVVLKLFETGTTDSFSALKQEGIWQLQDGSLLSDSPGSLSWSGPVFRELRVTLRTGPEMGIAELTINGKTERLDLFDPQPNEKYLVTSMPLPALNRILMTIAYWIPFSSLFFILLTMMRFFPLKSVGNAAKRTPWLLYALPMVLVWGIVWLTCYPALMSPDSVGQWHEALTGQFTDWHPAIYAILMRVFSFGMQTPGLIPLFQIGTLAVLVARGIHFLETIGVPAFVRWLTVVLFSFSPVAALFQSTLWKDIPFGISFFALFLMLLRYVLAADTALGSLPHPLEAGFAGAGAALFRHNGLPVVIVTLLIFLIAYKPLRKRLFSALLLVITITLLVRGPIYAMLQVKPDNGSGANQILIHAISAHVVEGTPLDPEDHAWLSRLYPLEQWIYNPWTAGSLLDEPGFNRELMYANTLKNLSVLGRLTISSPLTTLRHLLRASDMIWHIPCDGCYLYKSILSGQPGGQVQWIVPNEIGIEQESKLPGLALPVYRLYEASAREPLPAALIWRPAFASWWIFLIVLIKSLRLGKKKFLFAAVLPLCQFLLMILITFAQDMRFQYGVILCALFSTALFFIPEKSAPAAHQASLSNDEHV